MRFLTSYDVFHRPTSRRTSPPCAISDQTWRMIYLEMWISLSNSWKMRGAEKISWDVITIGMEIRSGMSMFERRDESW